MKVLNIVMLVAFVLSVIVQFNDPDPLLWVLLYTAAVVVCLLYRLKPVHWGLPLAVGLVALVWSLSLFAPLFNTPESIVWGDVFGRATMKTNAVELTREIGGLLIVVVWMGVLAFAVRKQESGDRHQE